MKSPFGHVAQVIGILEPKERRRLLYVTIGAVFMALVEVIGVGSIMPFMAVAAKPEVIRTNATLKAIYDFFGFRSDTSFLIFLGVGVLSFLILTNVSQAFLQYIKTKFTSMRRHSLGLKLFKGYLGQEYPFFLNRNSYEFVKNITGEVGQLINGTLIQLIDFIARAIQVLVLISFLMIVNPITTLMVVAVVGILYGGIYASIRNTIKKLGVERFELTRDVSKVVSEAFWGIKEVKITGTEAIFADEYMKPSRRLAQNASTSELLGDIPKFALETAAFSSIMLFVLLAILREGSFANAAATVSLFAYAGYRLIPAIQGLFKAVTKLKYGAPTAERMAKEFFAVADSAPLPKRSAKRIPLSHELELKDIAFSYPNTDRQLFTSLNLTIAANSLVGFAGKTGSGKTTAVDIILGLLKPQSGLMLVDGNVISEENIREWQANLGYVPQNIYLSNDTLAANIAFGIPRDKIDMAEVERAAKMAQIHDFIAAELREGYGTFIGERGIRISGGQRQRVGIARALYRNPSVLIMDEATSALDNQTERAVMEAIDSLQGTKTIILIAHRLTTLKKCDNIYLLEKGRIIDSGSYESLETSHEGYFGKH